MAKAPYQRLFYAVGRGLHTWSLVEMNLAFVFGALSGQSGQHSHELFGTVISFETRNAMCDKLISLSELTEEEKAIWSKLSARLTKFYKKRHELAHFTVTTTDRGEEIILPFRTTATILEKNRKELRESQIHDRAERFLELCDALKWFYAIIYRRRMPRQEPLLPPLEEPPLVAQLRELVNQTP